MAVDKSERDGKLSLQLTGFDRPYFEYIRSLEQPSAFESAFVKPTYLPSNVNEGYGFFYMTRSALLEIVLP